MLHLTKDSTDILYFTAIENAVLSNPNYLFIFTSSNNDIVKFVKANESTNDRYQKASVVTNTYFANYDAGMWRYKIREQASSSNTDEDLSGSIVEEGFMYLHEAVGFTPTVYDEQDNTFITYNPE